MLRIAALSLTLLVCGGWAQDQKPDTETVFGTTVVVPTGLEGDIYFVNHLFPRKIHFDKKHSKGTIYTTRLNVPPQDFTKGFPGVTDRLEWFAINYYGKFYVTTPGVYRFRLLSDDGSLLYVDGQTVIDNAGLHPPQAKDGSICLASGVHNIQVPYLQGPKYQVALVLEVAPPGGELRIFDTNAFKPPPGDPSTWPPADAGPCGGGKK